MRCAWNRVWIRILLVLLHRPPHRPTPRFRTSRAPLSSSSSSMLCPSPPSFLGRLLRPPNLENVYYPNLPPIYLLTVPVDLEHVSQRHEQGPECLVHFRVPRG